MKQDGASADTARRALPHIDRNAPGHADPHTLEPAAVDARFRWARRRGEPRWLWPEVQGSEWRVALAELERTAGALLAGEGAVRLHSGDAARARALGVAAYTSGLGPWLGWQLERGSLHGDGGVTALLAAHLDHARRRARRFDAVLEEVLAVLARAGVEATLLKGVHGARAYFAEPALRPMADIDVLVARPTIDTAERALREAGYTLLPPERGGRPYRSNWRPPSSGAALRSLTLTHAEDPIQVDLHGSLDVDFFGVRTIHFDEVVAAHRQPALELGANASVLRQPLLVAHHAVHASQGLHGLTLIRLVELALMIRRDVRTAEEWSRLRALLRQLHAERFAYPAFALVDKLLPGIVDAELAARLAGAATPRLRGIVEALRPATAQRLEGLALDERFMWSAGPVEHLRRVRHMLLPTGVRGSTARLLRIYADRAFRLLRGRVSWRDGSA